MVLAPGSDPSVTIDYRDPRSWTSSSWPTGSGSGAVSDAGGPAVDPNQWATDAINALNEAEQLLKDLTTAISTGDVGSLDGRTYGFEMTGTGSSGDTLAAAFISTKVQSVTGGVTDIGMKAAQKALETQKKVFG